MAKVFYCEKQNPSLMGCDKLIVNAARLDDLIETLTIFNLPYYMKIAMIANLLWREN